MGRVVCRLDRGLKELRGPARASAAASSGASAASSSAVEARGGGRGGREMEGIRSSLRNDIVSHPASPLRKGPPRCIFQHLERRRGRSLLFCVLFFLPPHVLTSSSFFLMRVSVSTSGEFSGSRGMGLSTRFSAFILLRDVRGINKESGRAGRENVVTGAVGVNALIAIS